MIKSVKITNYLGESINLPLRYYPERPSFIIREIEGLGPMEADLNMTEMATIDGALDNSARANTRNIVFSLIFMENEETPLIEDVRLLTYKYFPLKRPVTIEVQTDRRLCRITGRVETNNPDIFSDQEGCEISIICAYPYFTSVDDSITAFGDVIPLFHFPFSNNKCENIIDYVLDGSMQDILDDQLVPIDTSNPNIVFGKVRDVVDASIDYFGDEETGVILTIHSIGRASGIRIRNGRTREEIVIDDFILQEITSGEFPGLLEGDDLVINSNIGKKTVTLIRHGETFNVINALGRPIEWFLLAKGANPFVCTAEHGVEYLQFSVSTKVLYEGV